MKGIRRLGDVCVRRGGGKEVNDRPLLAEAMLQRAAHLEPGLPEGLISQPGGVLARQVGAEGGRGGVGKEGPSFA